MLKIAVIGTAGRGEDFERLCPSDFDRMCGVVYEIINNITNEPYLVSGGAAWADHVAVKLFDASLVEHLSLHLPADWDRSNQQYRENWRTINDSGRISNHYHHQFSNKTGINSLTQLDQVLKRCHFTISNGFFKRNNDVAKAQAVIALTFGEGAMLKDGGTANTFKQYLSNLKGRKNLSYHVDLNDWTLHTPARLK